MVHNDMSFCAWKYMVNDGAKVVELMFKTFAPRYHSEQTINKPKTMKESKTYRRLLVLEGLLSEVVKTY